MALYAFDGTTNEDQAEDGLDTNVVKFAELYQGQNIKYLAGVGTRFGALGKVIGGLFGAGGRSRVEEMTQTLTDNYRNGDTDIDVIGFSRGAALAVHFCNQIADKGIQLADGNKVKPPIRFLGLWDTVASFGLSFNNIVNFQQINLGWDIDTVSQTVQNCFHAMSLDERRESFGITRLNPDNHHSVIQEMWFRGVHSDVGGGNNNPRRSNIALNWMLEQAINCDLKFDAVKAALPKYSDTSAQAVISENADLHRDERRTVLPADQIHPTASSKPLQTGGQPHQFVVRSHSRYNWSGVRLESGKEYEIKVLAGERWRDGSMECDANGWRSEDLPLHKEVFVEEFEKNRRCREANWFELIGAYSDEDRDMFRIGRGTVFKAKKDADLYTFANDLNTRYENNQGEIRATIQRIS